MLEKHQRETCTRTPSTCTGTPMHKSGREQHVSVHLCRKVAEPNMYRYTCVETAGIEQEFDPNTRARLSINF